MGMQFDVTEHVFENRLESVIFYDGKWDYSNLRKIHNGIMLSGGRTPQCYQNNKLLNWQRDMFVHSENAQLRHMKSMRQRGMPSLQELF